MNINGSVSGDVVGGNKTVTQTAGGDIVGGDKLTHTGTGHIFAGSGDVLVIQPQLSPAGARDRANLRLLLNKVKAFWIEGVLQRSVHRAGLLELGLELRGEAVAHPWASVLELPNASRRPLPPGTLVSQVFDEAQHALLILGEPGAGKTTTLLELARDLIARAEADSEAVQPVPVVFNLSSWHSQRLPLGAWMASELATKYQVPTRIGRAWLDDQRLLPLLDGLDEVAPAWQAACVTAINHFTQTQGAPGIAVCSRLEDYTRLPVRLRLNAAICLSPLSPGQVSAYLAAGGPRLAALREVMGNDDVLAVMARTPLLLSIMSLAYQDLPPDALTGPALRTVDERRRHLFDQYVASMLGRKGRGRQRFSDAALVKWTSWLARQMSGHNQTVFLSERMQPSWLSSRAARWVYALVSRVSEWWLLGLGFGSFLVLFFLTVLVADETFAAMVAAAYTESGLFDYLGIVFGIARDFAFMGLIAGVISAIRLEISARLSDPAGLPWMVYLRPTINLLNGSVLPSLAVIPLMWRPTAGIENALARLMLVSLLCLPVVVLSSVAFRAWDSGHSPQNDIPVADVLHWSWVQGIVGGLAGFHAGALMGAACMLTLALANNRSDLIARMATGVLPGGIIVGTGAGLITGLRAKAIEGTPESGRWLIRHARNVLAASLLAGLSMGLCGLLGMGTYQVLTLSGGSFGWQPALLSLGFGLTCAILAGTVAALYYGGTTLMRHVILRLLLIALRRIPRSLSEIANQAEEVVFLRRVGGGYIFIHGLVLQYFAALPAR